MEALRDNYPQGHIRREHLFNTVTIQDCSGTGMPAVHRVEFELPDKSKKKKSVTTPDSSKLAHIQIRTHSSKLNIYKHIFLYTNKYNLKI